MIIHKLIYALCSLPKIQAALRSKHLADRVLTQEKIN